LLAKVKKANIVHKLLPPSRRYHEKFGFSEEILRSLEKFERKEQQRQVKNLIKTKASKETRTQLKLNQLNRRLEKIKLRMSSLNNSSIHFEDNNNNNNSMSESNKDINDLNKSTTYSNSSTTTNISHVAMASVSDSSTNKNKQENVSLNLHSPSSQRNHSSSSQATAPTEETIDEDMDTILGTFQFQMKCAIIQAKDLN
jgi:septal ring factor EnvC (AmiA/AmiB activator)